MFSKIIFTIPIYLRSEEQYYKEKNYAEKKAIAKYGKTLFGKRLEIWWPPWRFNDVIGYLTVNLYESSLFVFRYFVQSKRIIRDPMLRRKAIIAMDPEWELEMPLPQNHTNESLRYCLINLLYKAKKDLKKTGYFVDIEYYNNLINCLDIVKYLELLGNETHREVF